MITGDLAVAADERFHSTRGCVPRAEVGGRSSMTESSRCWGCMVATDLDNPPPGAAWAGQPCRRCGEACGRPTTPGTTRPARVQWSGQASHLTRAPREPNTRPFRPKPPPRRYVRDSLDVTRRSTGGHRARWRRGALRCRRRRLEHGAAVGLERDGADVEGVVPAARRVTGAVVERRVRDPLGAVKPGAEDAAARVQGLQVGAVDRGVAVRLDRRGRLERLCDHPRSASVA